MAVLTSTLGGKRFPRVQLLVNYCKHANFTSILVVLIELERIKRWDGLHDRMCSIEVYRCLAETVF